VNLWNILGFGGDEFVTGSPESVLFIILSIECGSDVWVNLKKRLSLLVVVESGVGLGDLWVKSMNLFWLWVIGS
jgi:hypothetical protein